MTEDLRPSTEEMVAVVRLMARAYQGLRVDNELRELERYRELECKRSEQGWAWDGNF